jgi:hypothetical protein
MYSWLMHDPTICFQLCHGPYPLSKRAPRGDLTPHPHGPQASVQNFENKSPLTFLANSLIKTRVRRTIPPVQVVFYMEDDGAVTVIEWLGQ